MSVNLDSWISDNEIFLGKLKKVIYKRIVFSVDDEKMSQYTVKP